MRAFFLLVLITALAGCGSSGAFTADDAVDAFVEAGLDAPNRRDVTAEECTEIGCLEAVATDVVTVYRWPDADQAKHHSTGLEQPAYALNEFVIAFPVGTDAPTNEYADALQRAVSSPPG